MSGDIPGMQQPRKARRRAIFITAAIAFVIAATCAALLCRSYSENETQAILNRQRDVQQTQMDKSLDAIRVWRVELVNQARFISSSEMFRIFITDTRDLTPEQLKLLAQPEALHSPDDNIRSLAEQRVYMRDLLRDFVRRRSWNDARLISANGQEILARESAPPLTRAQDDLVKRAVTSRLAIFGPIRQQNNNYYLDMADPLFEVLGGEDLKCVAVLLLSVPIEKPLINFLSSSSGHEDAITPRIVDQTRYGTELIMLSGNHLSTRTLKESLPQTGLPFGLREGLASIAQGENRTPAMVYSMASQPTLLDWQLVLETPASVLDARIHSREWQIYGLGALATVGLTLLAAFIFANMTSRQYKARAAHLHNLYNTIRQQKLVLDGVNNSLQAGLLLVDDTGKVQMANQAFQEISSAGDQDMDGLPLVELLPAQASVELTGAMRNVIETGESATIELALPQAGQERLFRVTLFPYQSEAGEETSSGSGCVAILQDITQFRANAKKAAKRQEALLTAMDRAIESADPNLVGQSPKMASVSSLLATELNLDPAQKETLRIASLLSQIGKLFVPRELLLKQGSLTPEEKKEVGRAPEHADRILADLHFDLPVRETVLEMGERLDGTGPKGLKADQISPTGRVLAVVNAFIAMTSPRAWRAQAGMAPDEAIRILAKDTRFDPDVIAALGRLDQNLLKTILGQKQ